MSHILQNLFTGKDNETLDIGRVLWALSVITFLIMGVYSIRRGHSPDFLAYGTGLAALLAAGGAALGLKAKTEPDKKE